MTHTRRPQLPDDDDVVAASPAFQPARLFPNNLSVAKTSPGPGPPIARDSDGDGDRGFADLTAAVFHPTLASAEVPELLVPRNTEAITGTLELSNSGFESLIMGDAPITVLQLKTTHGVRRLCVPESLSSFGHMTHSHQPHSVCPYL
jgi:hypothetical protein